MMDMITLQRISPNKTTTFQMKFIGISFRFAFFFACMYAYMATPLAAATKVIANTFLVIPPILNYISKITNKNRKRKLNQGQFSHAISLIAFSTTFAVIFIQQNLTQPDRSWGHFHILIFFNIFQSLFKAKFYSRSKFYFIIRA